MSDIALENGDIVISQFGDLATVISENDDIIQQAINNIHTILGELYLHPELGNPIYGKRYKITDDMSDVEAECEDTILQDTRIDTVDSITATMSEDTPGGVDIDFLLTTVNGDILSSSTTITTT